MKPNLTVIIANYMRPDNVDLIVGSLSKDVQVFIVDNSPNQSRSLAVQKRADWILDSTKNNLTTRWYMASQADTPYYCIHDDDLMLWRYDDYVKNTKILTGPFGVKLHPDLEYFDCLHSEAHGDTVDIIKGRMMFGETDCLSLVPMPPRKLDGDYETIISEDIYISSQLPGPFKITNLADVVELPDHHASCSKPNHYQRRELARREYFNI